MPGKVVASDTAQQTIKQLQQTIDADLSRVFQDMRRLAQVLHQEEHWAGRHAAKFTGEIWPNVDRAMTNFSQQLEQLRREIDVVVSDIMSAGGNR